MIEKIYQKAKADLKTIVLPEAQDPRTKEAARFIEREGLARVVVLSADAIEASTVERFTEEFYQMRKHKGISPDEARKIVSAPLYYGAMMVRNRMADGFVAGAVHTTAEVVRAAIYCLGVDRVIGSASSCFLMLVPDCRFGDSGAFLFADCGVVPQPTALELSNIAISTAHLAREILAIEPRVAMLSYSTKGSSRGELVEKVREAVRLVREREAGLIIDGEMQSDTAIVPEIAKIKDPEGVLEGKATVLIFPNLEAGNIAYKLTERLARAKAYGPLLQGLNYPCSDLSRGCDAMDIVGCVAITAVRAQKKV